MLVDPVPYMIEQFVAALFRAACGAHPLRIGFFVAYGFFPRKKKAALFVVLFSQAVLQGLFVHPHQHFEDFEILHMVAGGRKQGSQHARLVEYQRLAPLPVTSEGGQRFPRSRHLLFKTLRGELPDREQRFNQRRAVCPFKRREGHCASPSKSFRFSLSSASAFFFSFGLTFVRSATAVPSESAQ